MFVGAPLGVSAKGTGVKALEFALSICQEVDIYGFTVDPGYLEWYGTPLLRYRNSHQSIGHMRTRWTSNNQI